MEINERVFFLLKQQKRTAKQLSEFIGVSQASISAWKNENSYPSSKHIISISEFFDVTPNYLLTGIEDLDDQNIRNLTPPQKALAESQYVNLTTDQLALLNAYGKLNYEEKDEVWNGIKYKLSKKKGLELSSQV